MRPDPASLRAAGRALDEQAVAVEGARSAVLRALDGTTWEAAEATRQRTRLDQLDARARTGADELHAGARLLRDLAGAVEQLQDDMRAACLRRESGLRAELTRAQADPLLAAGVPELHRHLAQLPTADDPYWSTQVPVPSVPMPSVPAAGVRASGAPTATGTVRIDLGQLRALARALQQRSTGASDARSAAAGAVLLPLGQLDAYGLPGSATGGFLSSATSSGGAAGQAAGGWSESADRATALADLVQQADSVAELTGVLDDPRTATALDVAVLLGSDADRATELLEGLSDADATWVLQHVAAGAVDDEYAGLSGPQGVLTAADVLAGMAGGAMQYNAAALTGTAGLQRSQALVDLGRALAADPAHVTPAQWYGDLDEARRLGGAADDLAGSADDLHRTSRSLPLRLGGGLAIAGIAYDISSGKDPTQAVVSGGGGFVASLAAGAATGAVFGTLIPIPGVGTAVGAIVGAGVGIFTSGAIDSLFEDGPDVGAALKAGGEALADTGGAIVDGAEAVGSTVAGWFD